MLLPGVLPPAPFSLGSALTTAQQTHKFKTRMDIQARNRIALLAVALALPLFASAQTPREYTKADESVNPKWPAAPVRAAHAMVVSDESLAAQAGVEIMKQGGNAVDAAVAVAFALAVVEPEAGNIGGGGFMLVRLASGRAAFVDYREQAPQRAARDMYLRPDGSVDPEASTVGYRSAGVPGTVAGLALALHTYGTMKLPQVMAPAIGLAADGFPVSERLARTLAESRATLQRFAVSRRIFLHDGALYQPGEILRQPELAATLRRIAHRGPAEFYRGQTARMFADEMQKMGGLITLDDLARYTAKIREPLRASYQASGAHWDLITSPPPSSGGIATIEALNILNPIPLKSWDDAQSVHWVVEAMRRVFADRAAYLGDSDFTHVPMRGLTDPRYAAQLRATMDPDRASSSEQVGAGNPLSFDEGEPPLPASAAVSPEELSSAYTAAGTRGNTFATVETQNSAAALALREAGRAAHTTHFSVVDSIGNAVANTYTLNDSYGSGVTCAAGFLLNDEMDDFTSRPGTPNMFGLIQSAANAIGPGKRPLSSMMPTILLRDGQLSFVTGSPGGPRIISATLLTILNWMRLGLDAQSAINAPRFHQQWLPDTLLLEKTFSPAVAADLQARGYLLAKPAWIGEVEAIGIDPQTGDRLGAPDPRREGVALGY
jgi:gamma-glutamyltranspeptidase / glutathione hydrolase